MSASRSSTPLRPNTGATSALVDRFERGLRAEVIEDGSIIRFGSIELTAVNVLRSDEVAYNGHLEEWREDFWEPEQRTVVDEILKTEATNGERFKSLALAIKKNRVVPFVGSGMSMPLGYPLWKSFLQAMRRRSTLTEAGLEDTFKVGYEEAAEAILAKMPSHLWDERFAATFGAKSPEDLSAPVQWLPVLFSESVITTNYDPVLERIYQAAGLPFDGSLSGTEVQEFRRRSGHGERFLVKIHGDHARRDTRVLTRTEYDRAYSPDSKARAELARLFTNRSLLFLGCSLAQDRTMDVLLDLAQKDADMPHHYALLPAPSSESDRLAREHFLAERMIFPIWYKAETPSEHNASLEAFLGILALESGKL